MSQQFCLKWNNHMNNMMDVFKNLLSTEAMVDVTLACDGLSLKAHRIVLSACSPFFQSLFLENPCKHPIVILKDMKYTELKAIIEFMYHGEVNVAQEQLSALMKTAETLRVKGLAEVTNDKDQSGDESSHRPPSRTGTPPAKRRKARTRKRSMSDQSDDGASQSKTRHPDSDIEELSSDMDRNTNTPYSVASTVPSQSHRTNSFHKSQLEQQPIEQHVEESFAQEEKFSIEPAKLLQQSLTTDDLPRRTGRSSVQSNMELQRRPQSSTDHHSSSLVPITSTPMSSDALVSNQQPESPIDIKPELLDLEPPMSPVAGPSHSADEENSMMYMDQSNMSSMSGPSGYQDNSALVSTDSQQQGIKTFIVFAHPSTIQGGKSTVIDVNHPTVQGGKNTVAAVKPEKKLKCSQCSYSCNNMKTMRMHIRSHTEEPPYKCSVCSYAAFKPCIIRQHLLTHTGEKPHECPICNKRFLLKYALTRHLPIHAKNKIFKCDECGNIFHSSLELDNHMGQSHNKAYCIDLKTQNKL